MTSEKPLFIIIFIIIIIIIIIIITIIIFIILLSWSTSSRPARMPQKNPLNKHN